MRCESLRGDGMRCGQWVCTVVVLLRPAGARYPLGVGSAGKHADPCSRPPPWNTLETSGSVRRGTMDVPTEDRW